VSGASLTTEAAREKVSFKIPMHSLHRRDLSLHEVPSVHAAGIVPLMKFLAPFVLLVLFWHSFARAEPRPIPFVENDYPRAVAEAKAARVPLAVVVWAPWCHACRYMETSVFTDRAMVAPAAQYRWAHLNADEPANAAFVARHDVFGFPALLVIDPRDESVVLARSGTATVDQVVRLLADGQAGYATRSNAPADRALAVADRAFGAQRFSEAAKAYKQALDLAPPAWSSRGRVLEALVQAHAEASEEEECATAAVAAIAALPANDANRGPIAFIGLFCAIADPKGPKPAAWRKQRIAALEPALLAAVAQPHVLYDNRMPALALIEARSQAGDAAGADASREAVLATLERIAVSAAPPPTRATAAAVFTFMASPATCTRFLPTLVKLDAETTSDYVPPLALARCLGMLGRHKEALAANTHALARTPPNRTQMTLLRARARLEVQLGDVAAARTSLQRATEIVGKLGTRYESTAKEIAAELAKLPK
jgi:tetratricopeptide (TPR) repeat protein